MRVSSIGKGLRQNPIPRSRLCEHISPDSDASSLCQQRMYVTCPHCQRSLCLHHINEHQLLVRSTFDAVVDRLNEYRYALTAELFIPPNSQNIVNNCLDEFRNVIIPYAQRTCCQNDVKQDDVDRIQIFADKMYTIVHHVGFSWEVDDTDRKRAKKADDDNTSNSEPASTKRARTDT